MGSKFCTDSLYIVTYVVNNIDTLIEIMPIFPDMDQTQRVQDPLFEQHAVWCKMSSFHS